MNTDQLPPMEATLPFTLQMGGISPEQFIGYYLKNQPEIEKKLLSEGAVKFTGIAIDSLQNFEKIVHSISAEFLEYIDGNSPRTKLSGKIYTSTEYDKTQRITMHNELSYSAKWPNKLFFTCVQPAFTGGETLLADSRQILRAMPRDIVSEVAAKGVIYSRNLHGGTGIGPSWQETFETKDKNQLEAYCRSYNIDFEWGRNDSLRLKQRAKGILAHRLTNEKVWFNQIDQFHPCHLGEEMLEAVCVLYDSPEDYPMYVKFGDGSEIDEAVVRAIINTIDVVTVAPVWERHELLIIDNELVSHGRNPYTGSRSVLVAMSA
jgi:hypothetical protein